MDSPTMKSIRGLTRSNMRSPRRFPDAHDADAIPPLVITDDDNTPSSLYNDEALSTKSLLKSDSLMENNSSANNNRRFQLLASAHNDLDRLEKQTNIEISTTKESENNESQHNAQERSAPKTELELCEDDVRRWAWQVWLWSTFFIVTFVLSAVVQIGDLTIGFPQNDKTIRNVRSYTMWVLFPLPLFAGVVGLVASRRQNASAVKMFVVLSIVMLVGRLVCYIADYMIDLIIIRKVPIDDDDDDDISSDSTEAGDSSRSLGVDSVYKPSLEVYMFKMWASVFVITALNLVCVICAWRLQQGLLKLQRLRREQACEKHALTPTTGVLSATITPSYAKRLEFVYDDIGVSMPTPKSTPKEAPSRTPTPNTAAMEMRCFPSSSSISSSGSGSTSDSATMPQ